MERSRISLRRLVLFATIVAVVLATGPGLAVAQSGSGVGGTVIVEEGETVDEIEALAGTVIVQGTVTGDVNAMAGNVYIEGDVGGNVEVATGNLEIAGNVEGDVSAAAGNVVLGEGATIAGDLQAGAGNVVVDGTVNGDVTVGAETTRLGDEAAVGGDLRYGGSLEGNTDAVAGTITHDSTLGLDVAPNLQPITDWIFAVYAFVLNLLLGAALLALFPRFSAGVADRVATAPARSGLVGLGVLVGVPLLLAAIAITIVGIPITIAGAFAFAFLIWVGVVYGRFAVAAWLLSYADVDNRWLALVVGLVGGALLGQIPILGGLLNLVIFLLGLGALSLGLYGLRRRPDSPARAGAGGPPAG